MLFEQAQPADDVVIGVTSLLVHAVGIMQPRRTVDAEADEKILRTQEFAPFVVEHGAVGLDGVVDLFAVSVLALQLDDLAEKLHPQQRRFPTLPGKRNLRHILAPDVLPHVGLEDHVGHFEIFVRGEELLFFEIEAVFAVEVADRPDGLGHDVEVGRRGGLGMHGVEEA